MKQVTLGGLQVRLTGGEDGDGGGDGPMVVLLHGFGAPGDDLVPVAGQLPVAPTTRFAFPEAPLSLPAELAAGAGRAWWMIDIMGMQMAMFQGRIEDMMDHAADGLPEANKALNSMLDELLEQCRVNPAKLILGGFSQGSMLALDVALRSQRPLAGLVLMSSTLLSPKEWVPLMEARADLPVLQSHGREDPLLPFALAERLRDELVGAGLPVTWVPFGGGHGIAPSVMYALSDFITLNQ